MLHPHLRATFSSWLTTRPWTECLQLVSRLNVHHSLEKTSELMLLARHSRAVRDRLVSAALHPENTFLKPSEKEVLRLRHARCSMGSRGVKDVLMNLQQNDETTVLTEFFKHTDMLELNYNNLWATAIALIANDSSPSAQLLQLQCCKALTSCGLWKPALAVFLRKSEDVVDVVDDDGFRQTAAMVLRSLPWSIALKVLQENQSASDSHLVEPIEFAKDLPDMLFLYLNLVRALLIGGAREAINSTLPNLLHFRDHLARSNNKSNNVYATALLDFHTNLKTLIPTHAKAGLWQASMSLLDSDEMVSDHPQLVDTTMLLLHAANEFLFARRLLENAAASRDDKAPLLPWTFENFYQLCRNERCWESCVWAFSTQLKQHDAKKELLEVEKKCALPDTAAYHILATLLGSKGTPINSLDAVIQRLKSDFQFRPMDKKFFELFFKRRITATALGDKWQASMFLADRLFDLRDTHPENIDIKNQRIQYVANAHATVMQDLVIAKKSSLAILYLEERICCGTNSALEPIQTVTISRTLRGIHTLLHGHDQTMGASTPKPVIELLEEKKQLTSANSNIDNHDSAFVSLVQALSAALLRHQPDSILE
eukprot:PhM_4_TR13329/c0_g1_i2/m.72740